MLTPRYASRGGFKLEAALAALQIRVRNRVCLDVGASTGGFTDCLLQHGAREVFALDVGKGQLDWKLRQDPRVVVLEGINARFLSPGHLPRSPELATADLSFISLRLILPRLELFRELELLLLVKPQFEAFQGEVEAGGRDPESGETARDPEPLQGLRFLLRISTEGGVSLPGPRPEGESGNLLPSPPASGLNSAPIRSRPSR